MAHVGELSASRVVDLRGIRALLLVALMVGSLAVAGLVAYQALVGPSGQEQVTLFLLSLSLMPLPAAAGMLLAGLNERDGLLARLGLWLAVAAWFLAFAGMVTHSAVPVLLCAIGGAGMGAHALWSGRSRMLAAWAVTMNVCLLAAAGFLAGVVIPTAHM